MTEKSISNLKVLLLEKEKEAFAPIEEATRAGEMRAEAEFMAGTAGWMEFNPEFVRV